VPPRSIPATQRKRDGQRVIQPEEVLFQLGYHHPFGIAELRDEGTDRRAEARTLVAEPSTRADLSITCRSIQADMLMRRIGGHCPRSVQRG
jgi:hypothetical protein